MGQLDNPPENNNTGNSTSTEALLRAMAQDLEHLKRNVIVQLNQDVERLQAEKNQLLEEINYLRNQRQQLPSQPPSSASQQEQQQQLIKQISQALATQLEAALIQGLNQQSGNSASSLMGAAGASMPPTQSSSEYKEDVYRLLSSLDTTLRTAFKTLQQDISSYQSSFSQQLGRMHSLEQQGEVILEALVDRLKDQLQTTGTTDKSTPSAERIESRYPPMSNYRVERVRDVQPLPSKRTTEEAAVAPTTTPDAVPVTRPKIKPSAIQLGFLLVLLSSLALSFQNVVIRIILKLSNVLGLFQLGGFISPSVGNSLLILWLRMLVVVPLMAILARILYPSVWKDIAKFLKSNDQPLFLNTLGSGFFLFLSQVLIYIALGQLTPGVAITIFFIYPIITVLLSWLLFGDRPSLLRSIVTGIVCLGVLVISLPTVGTGVRLSGLGIGTAMGSGIAFALYVILTQTCAKKINPVPFSLINFAIILLLSAFSLLIPLPDAPGWAVQVNPLMWPGLIVSSIVLGGTTLISYLFNNIGISLIGAARSSIIGATGPALTALLAFLLIQEALAPQKIFGMLLVTAGVVALSFERMLRQKKAPSAGK